MRPASEPILIQARHDRDCGDLYSTLPLAPDLPVRLAEHYDRNPEKQLLKGRIGYVKSVVLDDREDSAKGNAFSRSAWWLELTLSRDHS